jgi:predicted flap endonuclease-1-like 5' DNA nuclease/glutathione synthase/RimK-type ligase-like ATP-grasp enzyme
MKKIGILFGQENSFPWAFIDRVNEKKIKGVMAEAVTIDKVMQGEPTEYAVIIDRISQDVPFYRAYLKNAAISGCAVINNPFWWSADEKFFNNALALKLGIPVPNTVILPSKEMPNDTKENSFRNLQFPLDWEGIFKYIGFPAYMKPYDGGGWKNVYKISNMEDFFEKYAETAQYVMMLQSEVHFTEYFRCYCLGGKNVHIMQYEPRNPHHLRYVVETGPSEQKLLNTVKEMVLKLNNGLGYDFNTVEFAIQDGIPYAIDFCNPAPDADVNSVGQTNFDWIVENAANMAIERALAHKEGANNLTWGTFMRDAVAGKGYAANNIALKAAPVKVKVAATPKTSTPKKVDTKPVEKKVASVKKLAIKKIVAKKAPVVKKVVAKPDDLKKIEGIGPKIAIILKTGGIHTFAELSKTLPQNIKKLLDKAGKQYAIHDPATWPKQAALAASGNWTELDKLQKELTGGKKK